MSTPALRIKPFLPAGCATRPGESGRALPNRWNRIKIGVMDAIASLATDPRIRIARWIFLLAAVYGIPVLGIWFFHTPAMVGHASRQQPEIYYGFAGLGVAWQIVFLLIAGDPLRYRPLMLISAICEKFFFSGMLVVLLIRRIARPHWIPAAVIDGSLGVAFFIAYVITAQCRNNPQQEST